MKPLKNFNVFGEPVDELTDSQLTGGKSCALIQTSPPGGGPPPHLHQNEDETFFVLEGNYEFLSNGEWKPIPAGETVHSRRGSVHTFRNAGSTIGRMLVFVAPAGLESISKRSPRSPYPTTCRKSWLSPRDTVSPSPTDASGSIHGRFNRAAIHAICSRFTLSDGLPPRLITRRPSYTLELSAQA